MRENNNHSYNFDKNHSFLLSVVLVNCMQNETASDLLRDVLINSQNIDANGFNKFNKSLNKFMDFLYNHQDQSGCINAQLAQSINQKYTLALSADMLGYNALTALMSVFHPILQRNNDHREIKRLIQNLTSNNFVAGKEEFISPMYPKKDNDIMQSSESIFLIQNLLELHKEYNLEAEYTDDSHLMQLYIEYNDLYNSMLEKHFSYSKNELLKRLLASDDRQMLELCKISDDRKILEALKEKESRKAAEEADRVESARKAAEEVKATEEEARKAAEEVKATEEEARKAAAATLREELERKDNERKAFEVRFSINKSKL